MKEKNITVAYVSANNPRDRKSWSGTHYRMLCALENEFSNVEVIGPFRLHFMLSFFLKLRNLKHNVLYKKKYDRAHCHLRSKYYARIITKKLKNKNIDVIFAPVGSVEIAHLKTHIPICHLGDSSFNQIKDYYKSFSGISKKSINEANSIEQKSIDNSAVQVFSSKWAADYAKSYYKAKNPVVIGFGANIEHSKITVIPFLNKNLEKDREIFDTLLCESHILFVPTRADCTPIVFCEASAYGITTITTDTGGVTSIIENDINGYALSIEAKPKDYAEKISALIENSEILKRLSNSSREKYDKELNWNVWGQRMKEILVTIAKQKNN